MEPVERKGRGAGEILTIREVAGYLKLPVSTVYRLAERRDLPGHKVGRQWRFHKSVLDDWFRQHAATSRYSSPGSQFRDDAPARPWVRSRRPPQ